MTGRETRTAPKGRPVASPARRRTCQGTALGEATIDIFGAVGRIDFVRSPLKLIYAALGASLWREIHRIATASAAGVVPYIDDGGLASAVSGHAVLLDSGTLTRRSVRPSPDEIKVST